jgi:hypothetical protein
VLQLVFSVGLAASLVGIGWMEWRFEGAGYINWGKGYTAGRATMSCSTPCIMGLDSFCETPTAEGESSVALSVGVSVSVCR